MNAAPEFLLLGQPTLPSSLRPTVESDAGKPWRDALSAGKRNACSLLSDIRGGFAMGVRDGSGRALLAVDRFATHSLCYRVDGNQLLFAERADALGKAELEPQALFDYLYYHVIPSPRTVFKGVYRLPPGHCLWFENGQVSIERYWTPVFTPAKSPNFDSLKAEFRTLLVRSVERQLGTGRPACFLSGGTDSSTVAGMIREASGQGAASYSIGFDAQGYDEMAYARIAAKAFGCEHHEYYVTPDDLVAAIPAAARFHDQPFGNSSALPTYYCALRAKEQGIEKLLAGDGGDELFGGNARYAKQRVFGWYHCAPPAIQRGLLEPLFFNQLAAKTPLLRKAHSYIEQAREPMPERMEMYNLLLRLRLSTVLSPAFLALINPQGPRQEQRETWNQIEANGELNQTLAFDWRYTLAENDLPKVRHGTQMAGVDVGFPLLDEDLLDFSLRLPDDYKLRGLKLRWFFKEALKGFLPDEIITKQKHGFGLPFGVWATQHKALRQLATDSLMSLAERGLIRSDFIDTLLRVHLPAHPGYYGEMVWILMMLEQWIQVHAPTWRLQ
jgi:asparagine synthase (glutamine-hydrolysing)